MKKIVFLLLGTLILSIAIFTHFFGNAWYLTTDSGYFIPAESNIFTFNATKWNDGSGDWWLYGEDKNYYYGLNIEDTTPKYFALQKGLEPEKIDKFDYKTWFPIASEHNYLFESLDSKFILTRLFDNPEIDSTGAALWVPNYGDAMKLSISFDGKCHTNVDTVLYFNDYKNEECAAVIFTHYVYEKGSWSDSTEIYIGGDHFTQVPLGIALFTKQKDGKWKIYCFEKLFSTLGYFGTYRTGRKDEGKISLKKIGDNWTCLSLWQGIGGSAGISWGYESLYSIERYQFCNQQDDEEITEWYDNMLLQNMLTYNYYFSYSLPDEDRGIEKSTVLKIIPKKNDYYDIELVIQENGKVSTEKYFYSEQYGKYIQK